MFGFSLFLNSLMAFGLKYRFTDLIREIHIDKAPVFFLVVVHHLVKHKWYLISGQSDGCPRLVSLTPLFPAMVLSSNTNFFLL